MADHTKIEWTDATWNPITGCTLVSDGCRNCYAAQLAATRLKHHPSRAGLARLNADGVAKFTGEVRFNEQWLDQPLRWKKPRMIFVCAHGDLFHESVPDAWIDQVFAVMALAPRHIFQVLTKRPERARTYLGNGPGEGWSATNTRVTAMAREMTKTELSDHWTALGAGRCSHILFGASAEDQHRYELRRNALLDVGSWLGGTFLSAEPLLGPLELAFRRDHCDLCGGTGMLARWPRCRCHVCNGQGHILINGQPSRLGYRALSWVIAGGESGANARPMHPDWVRSLRDQCAAADVPFLFKQWGEWAPQIGAVDGWSIDDDSEQSRFDHLEYDIDAGTWGRPFRPAWCDWDSLDESQVVSRIGKRRAGRLLDGIEHNAFPEVQS